MPRTSTTNGYRGRGRFTLRPLAGGKPFELGNAVNLNETIEVDRQARQDYQDAGGELDVIERVTSYTFEVTVNDITPQNIALGLRGTVAAIGPAEVTDEALHAWPGVRSAFKYLPDPDETVTVTTAETTPTTLVAGEDYELTPHGLRLLPTPVNVTPPVDEDEPIELRVTYHRNPQSLIQALVNTGLEFEMTYEGYNEIDSGNPNTVRYFRVKFSPTSGFQRHGGDEFAELALAGTVLKAPGRTGEGLSAYMEQTMI